MNYKTDVLYMAAIFAILSAMKLSGVDDSSWIEVSMAVLVYPAIMLTIYAMWYACNKVADFVHWVGF